MKLQIQQQPTIHCVFSTNSQKGNIFISNYSAASDLNILKQHNIKAVITIARYALLYHSKEDIPNYLYIPADDIPDFDIGQYFDKTNKFIQKSRKRTNVLIHCVSGISRSATIIIAYLMNKQNYTHRNALVAIKKVKKKIKPNNGFIEILKNYQQSLNQTKTLQIQHQIVPLKKKDENPQNPQNLINCENNSQIFIEKQKPVNQSIKLMNKKYNQLLVKIEKLKNQLIQKQLKKTTIN